MRTIYKLFKLLLLLIVLVSPTKTETLSVAARHAEEEEEEISNVVIGNDSSGTIPPNEEIGEKEKEDVEDVSSKEEDLVRKAENDTEPELQKSADGKDSHLQNGLDYEALEASIFLPEGVSKEEAATSSIFLAFQNDTLLESQSITDMVNETISCSIGDRRCAMTDFKPMLTSHTLSIPIFNSSSIHLWNILKPMKSPVWTEASGQTHFPTSIMQPVTGSSKTITSNVQTSDNLIVIDNKGESVIQPNPTDKSEKAKPIKTDETFAFDTNQDSHLRTSMKMFTVSISKLSKDASSSFIHRESPTIVRKPIDVSSTTLYHSEMNTKTLLSSPVIQMSTDQFVAKSSSYQKVISSESSRSTVPSYLTAKLNEETMSFDIPELQSTFSVVITDRALTSGFSSSSFPDSTRYIVELTSSVEPSSTEITSPLFTQDVKSPSSSEIPDKASSDLPRVTPLVEVPTRTTYPSCSSLPICIEVRLLEMAWKEFCPHSFEFQKFLSKTLSKYMQPVHPLHIILEASPCREDVLLQSSQKQPHVTVAFYVTNFSGDYDETLTEICGIILKKRAPRAFQNKVLDVRIPKEELLSTPLPILPELNTGFVAAVSLSAVAGVALCLLCILLVVMKQKLLQSRNSETEARAADAYSLDSLSISASFRRRRNGRLRRSYLNHAFNDQEFVSHPLNEKSLANCLKNKELLEEEFRKIPLNMPKLEDIPEGADVKNRYSNILPNPESRVILSGSSEDSVKSYINANYVKGYDGKTSFYIACQAPLADGIEDFWKMIWEQQCKLIIMLTNFEENGVSRCAQYFPESTLTANSPFGDFQVTLKKKDVYDYYTLSTIRLLDLEKNLFRDVIHFWYTKWPEVGVPRDPANLISFLIQCRPFINCNSGPTVVHCSTGTGRTGVFLALDMCMREYDESRSIDILRCVTQLRKDRAGAVQNKDQYILIYEAMLEYLSQIANQSQRASISRQSTN